LLEFLEDFEDFPLLLEEFEVLEVFEVFEDSLVFEELLSLGRRV